MPTTNPRINVTLNTNLYKKICKVAKKRKSTKSTVAAELIEEALDNNIEMALDKKGERKSKTFDMERAVDHEEAWNK